MSILLQLSWLDIIKASSKDTPSSVASFASLQQAFTYVQAQNGETQADTYQIVTNDENFYWVVTTTLAQELLAHGFWILSAPTTSSLPSPE
ncbi:hypothetical protein GCM10027577_32040 [Spirosoma fluminis]